MCKLLKEAREHDMETHDEPDDRLVVADAASLAALWAELHSESESNGRRVVVAGKVNLALVQ